MKKLSATLCLAALIALPSAADAKTLTLRTTLKNYGGQGSYLAIYLTDAQGKFHSTLHVAGRKSKYHRHLRDWARASRSSRGRIDGITGASVGSGRTLNVSVTVADTLIDAGYQIRIDTAVEDGSDVPADVIAPLSKASSGKPVAGRGHVKSFTVDM